MGTVNYFDSKTTWRLSIMLLAAGGSLTFAAFNMIAAGIAGGKQEFAAEVASSLGPLVILLGSGLGSFVFAILSDHPEVPEDGGRWSKRNFRESAFPLISIMGLSSLVWATFALFSAATVVVE